MWEVGGEGEDERIDGRERVRRGVGMACIGRCSEGWDWRAGRGGGRKATSREGSGVKWETRVAGWWKWYLSAGMMVCGGGKFTACC